MRAESLQLCPTLCNPLDCSPPGSSVHGILQAKILEWVAFPLFRGSSWLRDPAHISHVSCIGRQVLYHWCHLASPLKNGDSPSKNAGVYCYTPPGDIPSPGMDLRSLTLQVDSLPTETPGKSKRLWWDIKDFYICYYFFVISTFCWKILHFASIFSEEGG